MITSPQAWGKLVAPWAEYVTRALSAAASQSKSILSSNPPTRLTQQCRREAKGKLWLSTVEPPEPERLCRGCGKTNSSGRLHRSQKDEGGKLQNLAYLRPTLKNTAVAVWTALILWTFNRVRGAGSLDS